MTCEVQVEDEANVTSQLIYFRFYVFSPCGLIGDPNLKYVIYFLMSDYEIKLKTGGFFIMTSF